MAKLDSAEPRCSNASSTAAQRLLPPTPTLAPGQELGRSPIKLDAGGRPRRVDGLHRLAFHRRLSQVAPSKHRSAGRLLYDNGAQSSDHPIDRLRFRPRKFPRLKPRVAASIFGKCPGADNRAACKT